MQEEAHQQCLRRFGKDRIRLNIDLTQRRKGKTKEGPGQKGDDSKGKLSEINLLLIKAEKQPEEQEENVYPSKTEMVRTGGHLPSISKRRAVCLLSEVKSLRAFTKGRVYGVPEDEECGVTQVRSGSKRLGKWL